MIVKRFQSLLVLVFALGIPWAAPGMEADERVPPAVQRQMEGTHSWGDRATFKGHVVNKGPVESKPFQYEWLIDGTRRSRGTHAALKPK